MAKKIVGFIKLQVPAGKANPSPPIGPALGANGVNPGQFITKFNAMSAHLNGQVIGVLVTVYKDRTFDIELKSPPAAELLKALVKAEKGSGEPNKNKIGKVTPKTVNSVDKLTLSVTARRKGIGWPSIASAI